MDGCLIHPASHLNAPAVQSAPLLFKSRRRCVRTVIRVRKGKAYTVCNINTGVHVELGQLLARHSTLKPKTYEKRQNSKVVLMRFC